MVQPPPNPIRERFADLLPLVQTRKRTRVLEAVSGLHQEPVRVSELKPVEDAESYRSVVERVQQIAAQVRHVRQGEGPQSEVRRVKFCEVRSESVEEEKPRRREPEN